MEGSGPLYRARENAPGLVSLLVTGIWLTAMFSGQEWWLPFMLFGYIVLVPVTSILFGEEEAEDVLAGDEASDESTGDVAADQADALETLRERYARGDLTDEQFERKLQRLLETETIEDVEDHERRVQTELDRE